MPRPTGGFLAHRALSVVLAVAAGTTVVTGLGLYERPPDEDRTIPADNQSVGLRSHCAAAFGCHAVQRSPAPAYVRVPMAGAGR